MQQRERKCNKSIACNLCIDERLQKWRHKDPEKTVIYMLTFNDKYASIYRRRKRHGLLMINRKTARLICLDSSSPLDIFTYLIWDQGRTPITRRPLLENEIEEGQRATSLLLWFFFLFLSSLKCSIGQVPCFEILCFESWWQFFPIRCLI